MSRIAIVLLLVTSAASAQSTSIVWQPPTLDVPDALPKASIKKEIITTLRVENVSILLEKTQLKTIADNLGGSIGSRGDAGEFLQWLCFHGSDANGRWALWLESDEMGGGVVDGFALQRIPNNAKVDRRCRTKQVQVDLPIRLGIGQPESGARAILGAPTAKYRSTLLFEHEHEVRIRNEPFTALNTVYVVLRGGVVSTIQVWKITSN